MPARQLTFKQYVANGSDDPPVNFWWRGLLGRPADLDAGSLLAGAGLTSVPLEHLSSGYLESPWQGTPSTPWSSHRASPSGPAPLAVSPEAWPTTALTPGERDTR